MNDDTGEKKGKIVKKKVNLLGSQGVGKTSLILRFVKSVFGDEYLKTIGTNVYKKTVKTEDGEIDLIIHDIMGEEAYESVQEGAFIGSTGSIAVADLTRPETLDKLLERWLPRYKEIASEDNPILLALNKFDLTDDEDLENLDTYKEHFDMSLFTSAKTGKNVSALFDILANKVTYNLQLAVEDIEDFVSRKDLSTPQNLVDALLAFASELGGMPYDTMEEILEKADIEKFDLDEMLEEIPEENAVMLAEELATWYRDREETYAEQCVLELLERYRGRSDG